MTTATAESIPCRTCRAAIESAASFCTFCGTPAMPTPYSQPPAPAATPPAAPTPAKSGAGSKVLMIFARIAMFAAFVLAKIAAREAPIVGLAIFVAALIFLIVSRIRR